MHVMMVLLRSCARRVVGSQLLFGGARASHRPSRARECGGWGRGSLRGGPAGGGARGGGGGVCVCARVRVELVQVRAHGSAGGVSAVAMRQSKKTQHGETSHSSRVLLLCRGEGDLHFVRGYAAGATYSQTGMPAAVPQPVPLCGQSKECVAATYS